MRALIVTVGGRDAGVVACAPFGWMAFCRPRGLLAHRRRHVTTTHQTAAAAVPAILGSPFSRAHGAGPFSDIRWSEAASLLAGEHAEAVR